MSQFHQVRHYFGHQPHSLHRMLVRPARGKSAGASRNRFEIIRTLADKFADLLYLVNMIRSNSINLGSHILDGPSMPRQRRERLRCRHTLKIVEIRAQKIAIGSEGIDTGHNFPQHMITHQHHARRRIAKTNVPFVMAWRLHDLEAVTSRSDLIPLNHSLNRHVRRWGKANLAKRLIEQRAAKKHRRCISHRTIRGNQFLYRGETGQYGRPNGRETVKQSDMIGMRMRCHDLHAFPRTPAFFERIEQSLSTHGEIEPHIDHQCSFAIENNIAINGFQRAARKGNNCTEKPRPHFVYIRPHAILAIIACPLPVLSEGDMRAS